MTTDGNPSESALSPLNELGVLATVVDATPDPLLILDEAGVIRLVNVATENLFEYPRDVLIGATVEMLLPERFRPDHVALREGFTGGADRSHIGGINGRPVIARTASGREYTIEVALNRVTLLDQPMVIAAVRDISERKQAAERLASERQRFRDLLDASPLAATFTVDGIFRYSNSKMLELFNADEGQPAASIYRDSSQRGRLLAQLEQEGALRNFPVQMVDRHGDVRDMLASFLPARIDDHVGVLAWLNDVTEQLQAERALEVSEQRLRDTSDAAGLGLWEYSIPDDMMIVNAMAIEILGYSTSVLPIYSGQWHQVPGAVSGVASMIHPEDAQSVVSTFTYHLMGFSDEYRAEYRVRRMDGQYKWVRSIGRVMARDHEGCPKRLSGVHIDIDQEKHLQDALMAARDEAERATRAKSDFLAKVTHEIRTPLSSLKGVTHLAKKTMEPTKLKQYLATADRSLDYVGRIIDDILDYSKIEAGKLDLETIPFDLMETLEHCVSLLRARADESGVGLFISSGDDVPQRLLGDPYRLQQIVMNLLSNAIKFSHPGDDVVIRLACLERSAEGALLHIAVADTGIGMTQDEQARLFKSYQQANTTITRTHGGTGLGLAISSQLADMMGGTISLKSAPGEGSTFTLAVRFVPAPDAESSTPATAGRPEASVGLEGLRVLLVDDNADNQAVIQELLELEDVVVVTADNGAEALERLRQLAFDVILMDCQMPVMDGYDAARAIRQQLELTTIPIYAMTGNVAPEDIQRALEAGMNDHIGKPIDPDLLLSKLSGVSRTASSA